ncbi:MAG: 3-oxoadipate enol-lactonase [Lautropia sp.]|nr:3-oxoadipate enol-lactonase [Lautropia sp.]
MRKGLAGSDAFSLRTPRGVFRVSVDGDAAAPVLVLGNSLGTTLEMWDPQVEPFSRDYRLIRFDTRGHGGSPLTQGPYTFDELGQDVLAILDALEIGQASYCGVSMGGHTALWLGIHAADRIRAIVACNTAARIGTVEGWQERADMVRREGRKGMKMLADSAPGRWFSDDFIARNPQVVHRIQQAIAVIDPEGYAACCDALGLSDLRGYLGRISVPSLVVAGAYDPVTTETDAKQIQAGITGARLAVLPASHLSNIEAAAAFTQEVLDFLAASRTS